MDNKILDIKRRISKAATKKKFVDNESVRRSMLTKHINFGDDREVTLDMVTELNIDVECLDSELTRQAASFGFVSVCREVASRRADCEKAKFEELKANRYFELKGGDFEAIYPGIKMTEDGIKHAMTLDAELKTQEEKYNKAQHDANILNSYEKALIQKKDMLQSLNSSINREYK